MAAAVVLLAGRVGWFIGSSPGADVDDAGGAVPVGQAVGDGAFDLSAGAAVHPDVVGGGGVQRGHGRALLERPAGDELSADPGGGQQFGVSSTRLCGTGPGADRGDD